MENPKTGFTRGDRMLLRGRTVQDQSAVSFLLRFAGHPSDRKMTANL